MTSNTNIDCEIEYITESIDINCNIIDNNNIDFIKYIRQLNISNNIKQYLIHLVENDNYNDYIEIYNICLENNIELLPI